MSKPDIRPMTARDIQRRLCMDLFQSSFVMPSYTPSGWFECDVFEITGAGYFREYEIKVSRSDFRADALKAKSTYDYQRANGRGLFVEVKGATKHERLAQRDTAGPVQFWFVVPRGMVTRDEVPTWAGLIEAEWCDTSGGLGRSRGAYLNWDASYASPPPRLHDAKLNPTVRAHANGTCYWRMHRMIAKGGDAGLEAKP